MIFLPGPVWQQVGQPWCYMHLRPGPRACDALSFSLDDCCSGTTREQDIKRFPFKQQWSRAALCEVTQPALGHMSLAALPETKRQSFPAAPLPLHPCPCPTLAARSVIGSEIELLSQCYADSPLISEGSCQGRSCSPYASRPLCRWLGNKESVKISCSD